MTSKRDEHDRQLRCAIVAVYFIRKLFFQFEAEFFSFVPLPGADQIIGLVAQFVKIV